MLMLCRLEEVILCFGSFVREKSNGKEVKKITIKVDYNINNSFSVRIKGIQRLFHYSAEWNLIGLKDIRFIAICVFLLKNLLNILVFYVNNPYVHHHLLIN